ncbi:histidine phosphatase family protein [Kitasatospora sp. NPDC086791]|uniref:SixA phosphatase family protein n=1 Tax=Kitasatospora sp. NPDC086791 TaxID=3155178 RepID=UPI003422C03C
MSEEFPRRIVLVRHAKAGHPDEVDDHERPLAPRGRKDAPALGRWLAGAGLTPDLALVSTALRTRETWQLVVPELTAKPRTVYEERLYDASPGELIAVLTEVSDEVQDVVAVGHNPGVHALADTLAGEADDDLLARMNRSGFPTAAAAVLTFQGSWKNVEPGAARLTAYWTPRPLST